MPRRALRALTPVPVPDAARTQVDGFLRTHGVDASVPVVAVAAALRQDIARTIAAALAAEGRAVVRVGPRDPEPVTMPGVVDLTGAGDPVMTALAVMARADLAIVGPGAAQALGYLSPAPAVVVDVADALSAYPLRPDGVLVLRTPVDLATGETLPPSALASEALVRSHRGVGFRPSSAADILSAVRELREAGTAGWVETPAQTTFRTTLVASASALADASPEVAALAPDDGWLGDGRLVAVQAARTA